MEFDRQFFGPNGEKRVPAFQITMDGEDLTSNFNDRLLSLMVTEHDGETADTLDIELDDRDCAIALPPKGKTLAILLGWSDVGLTDVGTYMIKTVKFEWSPAKKIIIHGDSADLAKPKLKAHRTNAYEGKSLADIAQEVAGRNGLQLQVNGGAGQTKYDSLAQNDESDMNLLSRLGREQQAIFKVAGGKLILSPLGSADVGGATMSTVINPGLVSNASVTLPDRSDFNGVTAYYFDQSKGQRVPVQSQGGSGGGDDSGGDDDGKFVMKHNFLNQELAQAGADAKASELDRAKATAHAELSLGDATVTASGTMTFEQFRDGMNGDYSIVTVEHNLDSSGYVTRIDADNGKGDGPDGSSD